MKNETDKKSSSSKRKRRSTSHSRSSSPPPKRGKMEVKDEKEAPPHQQPSLNQSDRKINDLVDTIIDICREVVQLETFAYYLPDDAFKTALIQKAELSFSDVPMALEAQALHEAIKKREFAQIQPLLEQGIDLNVENEQGETGAEVLDLLSVDTGTDQKLQQGESFQQLTAWLTVQRTIMAELITAIADNDEKEVRNLIRKKSPLQLKHFGYPVLYVAAAHGHVRLACLLLAAGTKVDDTTLDGATPLYIASRIGHLDMVYLLLAAGANINAQNRIGRTPLHAAVKFGQKNTIEVLLSNGANVDIQTAEGDTPLHIAIRDESEEEAILLAKAGAEWRIRNQQGLMPLEPYESIKKKERPDQKMIEVITTVTKIILKKRLQTTAQPIFKENDDLDDFGEIFEGIITSIPERKFVNFFDDINHLDLCMFAAILNENFNMIKILIEEGVWLHKDFKRSKALGDANNFHELIETNLHRHKNYEKLKKWLSSTHNKFMLMSFLMCKEKMHQKQKKKKGGDLINTKLDDTLKKHLSCLNYKDKNGRSLLGFSILYEQPRFAEKLLTLRADPYCDTNFEHSPICLAINKNKPEILKSLLKYGVHPKLTMYIDGALITPTEYLIGKVSDDNWTNNNNEAHEMFEILLNDMCKRGVEVSDILLTLLEYLHRAMEEDEKDSEVKLKNFTRYALELGLNPYTFTDDDSYNSLLKVDPDCIHRYPFVEINGAIDNNKMKELREKLPLFPKRCLSEVLEYSSDSSTPLFMVAITNKNNRMLQYLLRRTLLINLPTHINPVDFRNKIEMVVIFSNMENILEQLCNADLSQECLNEIYKFCPHASSNRS